MFVHTSWRLLLCLLTLCLHSGISDVNITSSPKLEEGTLLCDNQNVTLSCHTDRSVANITWHWSNRSEQGDTVTVLAKLTKIVYTCVVSYAADDGRHVETANITILANGSAPHVVSDNFYHYMSETEGNNLTLITSIISDLPLSDGYPLWQVLDHSLPKTAVVVNYTSGGVLHSNLTLKNLSYFEDSGNYTNTASNKCGTSFVYTFIRVTKAPIVCKDPGHIVKPLRNVTLTVQGEVIQLSCLFRGNLAVLEPSLTSYWKINFPFSKQHDGGEFVYDNSTDLYRIAIYQTCLSSDGSCCDFINELTILGTPLSLNNAVLECTEGLSIAGSDEPVYYTNDTTIGVLITPKLISGPNQLKDQRLTTLQCQFNASTYEGVTIVVWRRDNMDLTNSSLYNIIVNSEIEDQVISTLTINSTYYYGTYTCYCYYNRSLVTSHELISSNKNIITLHGHKQHRLTRMEKIGIYIGCAVGAFITIVVTLVVALYFIMKIRSARPRCNELRPILTPDKTPDDDDMDVVDPITVSTLGYGTVSETLSINEVVVHRDPSSPIQHEQDTPNNVGDTPRISPLSIAHQSSDAVNPIQESGNQD